MTSVFGVFGICAIAWLLSENRRVFNARQVICALLLNIIFIFLCFRIPYLKHLILYANQAVEILEKAMHQGTAFVFGYVGGADSPFEVVKPASNMSLAFQVFPLVVVMSALSSLLFYWRILPLFVKGFAFILNKTVGLRGPAGLSAAADVFLGMVEAPLLIRPYLSKMTRTELFVLMTAGMGTVAGSVMVAYAAILGPTVPDVMGHILISSVANVPAAIAVAMIMIPETQSMHFEDEAIPRTAENTMDALIKGTTEGLFVVLNICAMILVLIALAYIANSILSLIPFPGGYHLTLEKIFGYVCTPVLWLMGLRGQELQVAQELYGTKIVLNEFVAYLNLAKIPVEQLGTHGRIVLTYGLCGFANFASAGLLIASLTTMVPERRKEIGQLGLKSLISGVLATSLTATVVSVFLQ